VLTVTMDIEYLGICSIAYCIYIASTGVPVLKVGVEVSMYH